MTDPVRQLQQRLKSMPVGHLARFQTLRVQRTTPGKWRIGEVELTGLYHTAKVLNQWLEGLGKPGGVSK